MDVLRETMQKFNIGRGCTMRVWRQEALDTSPTDLDVARAVGKLDMNFETELSAAAKILEVGRVNAVEVLNGYGNGEVLYRDWP